MMYDFDRIQALLVRYLLNNVYSILMGWLDGDVICYLRYELKYLYISISGDGRCGLTQDKLSSFFGGLTGGVEIDIKFDPKENQKYHKIRNGKEKVKLPVYNKNDDMSGSVTVTLKDTKKYEHLGIKCYLIGYLGTPSLKQKSTPIKISPPSSTPSPRN